MADFNAKSGSLTKVNIIANIDTLRAVAGITSELGACILQLQGARVPVEAAQKEFTQASQQTNAYLQGHGKTLELLAEEDLRGRPDQQRWEAIQRHFNMYSTQIEASLAKQRPLEHAFRVKQLALAEAAIAQLPRLQMLIVPALVAVRRELGIPVDEAQVREIFNEVGLKIAESTRELINQMRSLIGQQQPQLPLNPP